MNEVRAAVKAVNLALKTVRFADAVKNTALVAAIAVCCYAIYRSFHR